MKILTASDNISQKSNFGVENLISRGFVASKVKKSMASTKPATKPIQKVILYPSQEYSTDV